jgi:hypothetical protein
MKIFALPLVALAIIFGLALAGPIHDRWEDSNAYRRQADALALERQETRLRDWHAQQQVTANTRALIGNLGWLGAGALLVIIVGYIGVQAHRRSVPMVKFAGEWVPRKYIEDGRLIAILAHRMEMQDIALIEDRRRPNVPHVFSPHYSSRSTDLALTDPTALLSAGTVPSFGDLLSSGRIGKGNPLVLGFDEADNSEVNGTWLDLHSTAIGGMPGTGKTTTQRFLACQTALQGARFAIIDPHGCG